MRGETYVAVEFEYPLLRHLWGPDSGCQDEGVACAGFFGVDAELLRLLGRLSSRSRDDQDVLEAVLVQGISCKADRDLAFVVREVLGFTVAPLN